METIGKRIYFLRKNSGLSQEKLAELIGKTKSNVSGYENDKFEPSAQTIIAICKLFKVSADWLLFGEEQNVLKLERTAGDGISLSPGDIELLAKYHRLPEKDQIKVEGIIEGLLIGQENGRQQNLNRTSSRSTSGSGREEAAARSETA